MVNTLKLELTASPATDDVFAVRSGLRNFNVAQVPELVDYALGEFAVIVREGERIVAGAICELDWGYLYFDTVWSDSAVRGKGYGTLVMQAAETFAVQQGVHRAYLYTTTFQARPFYEKLGYRLFGQVDDHPQGYSFFYLQKRNLQATVIDPRITIDAPPLKASASVIENGLLDEIAKSVQFVVRKVAVFLRDADGTVRGGIVGISYWDWFDLQLFWFDEAFRGQGWGKKALELLETDLRDRNLNGIRCETTSFQALPFYQSQGFEIVGTLQDHPPTHTDYFLKKTF